MAGQNPIGSVLQTAGSTTTVPFIQDGPTANTTARGIAVAGATFNNYATVQSTATVLKSGPGRLGLVIVTSNSTTIATALYDQSTSATATAASLILSIPGTVTVGTIYQVGGFPFANGLALIPTTNSGIGLSLAWS